MPSKKKKFNARFPPARIKKIMQTDEEVGKVAAPVPVIISRALELFIESLIVKSSNITKMRHAKTLSTAHIKHTILSEKRFDFLKDLVANVADVQADEEGTDNVPVCSRNTNSELVVKTRGRPRKKKADNKPAGKTRVKRQKKIDDDPDTEETDTATEEPASEEEEEDEEDEDDDEDIETDPDAQDSPKTECSAATSVTSGHSSQSMSYSGQSPEPEAMCSRVKMNTYPHTEALCSTKQTVTHSRLDQQTHSLDLRINQNKPSSSDHFDDKSCLQSVPTASSSSAVTCQGYMQSTFYTHAGLTSTQSGAAWSESRGQQATQCNPQHITACSEEGVCKQTEQRTCLEGEQKSFTVRQLVDEGMDKNDDLNKDMLGQENRQQKSFGAETIPQSDSLGGARSGVESAPSDSFPVYTGVPPVSMAFYPHHLGVVQQVNPYPAHVRPLADGMSPYLTGMMPYQAMAFPGHAVLPRLTPLPGVMDSRFGLPRMNSASTTTVHGDISEPRVAGQPPPAHTKQSQLVPSAPHDKADHPTS